ncbi:anthrone oxygenase family protein [Paractinoplanes bogorensis]|nr:anthrone oxygenase family protein [Actinoplanes bogorensis]
MFALRVTALIAATMTTGLMAGVFGLYQHTVMVGLGRTDDRTFIGAFQSMDRAIINPWFMLSFGGALIFTAVAAFLSPGRRILPWVLAALVLYIIVFAITVAVNVPMNDALKAAGDPATMTDPAAVRAAFDEARWSAFNLIRTIATTLAFGCLCWALVARGELG